MRTRGSCRFEPYFKVQVWDARGLAWRDVQAAHPTEADAWAAAPAGKRCRLMRIHERGREAVNEPTQEGCG